MNRAPNSDRWCKRCGAKLSSYNKDIECYPCQEREGRGLELKYKARPTSSLSKTLDTIEREIKQLYRY